MELSIKGHAMNFERQFSEQKKSNENLNEFATNSRDNLQILSNSPQKSFSNQL